MCASAGKVGNKKNESGPGKARGAEDEKKSKTARENEKIDEILGATTEE